MNAIILDMYGVIIKAPEGDLVPYIKNIFPNKTEETINYLWKEAACGRMTSSDFFKNIGFYEKIKDAEADYLRTIEIDEAFYPAAEKLKAEYDLALLSNDIWEWSCYLQDKYNLKEYFKESIISGNVGLLKPNVKIFEILLQRLKLHASDCYYVDDRERNLSAAEKLGMKTILFNRRKVSYSGAAVNSFDELYSYFKNLKMNNI